jgi:AcrR family transcriptional regulator
VPVHNQDNRAARSKATQTALMRAAEKLIAERGMQNVSLRDIVAAAGQKNESALQYHFKNFSGLINTIHAERSAETQTKRAELLDELLLANPTPSLRQICTLMVQPTFELSRTQVDYRRYVKAFGHELMLSETSPLSLATSHGAGGSSGKQLASLLKQALPHLDADAYRRRMEAAVRLCSASMYHQSRQKNAFSNEQGLLFFHSLIDALVGLLSSPVSDETQATIRSIQTTKQSRK